MKENEKFMDREWRENQERNNSSAGGRILVPFSRFIVIGSYECARRDGMGWDGMSKRTRRRQHRVITQLRGKVRLLGGYYNTIYHGPC